MTIKVGVTRELGDLVMKAIHLAMEQENADTEGSSDHENDGANLLVSRRMH